MRKLLLIFGFAVASLAASSQVINPPIITCFENLTASNNIRITWALPSNPCGAFQEFRLYGSPNPGGPFNLIADFTDSTQTSYTHVSALFTSAEWYYYMEAEHNCPGSTIQQSPVFQNLTPETSEIEAVSVENGQAVIRWKSSPALTTNRYRVNYFIQLNDLQAFDSTSSRLDTVLTDTVMRFDPNIGPVRFVVLAVDSCDNNRGNGFEERPHQTIFLEDTLDRCNRFIRLNWSAYINWDGGVDRYQIWVRINGGADSLVGSTDSSTLTFEYRGFNDFDDIDIWIRAINGNNPTIVSNSNVVNRLAQIVQAPTYLFVSNISNIDSNNVLIEWQVDTLAELKQFIILRGQDSTQLVEYERIDADDTLQPSYAFIDSNLNFIRELYFYEVRAVDSCDQEYSSGIAQHVRFFAEQNSFFENQLSWNPIIIPGASVSSYRIYRDIGEGFELFQELDGSANGFTDDLSSFFNRLGRFCYRVEIVYTIPGTVLGSQQQVVSSNVFCVDERPVAYIPNAFAPNGNVPENRVFKPTLVYAITDNYYMQVFSKSGKLLFETFDPDEGWDGFDKGDPAPSGGYAYYFRFQAVDGRLIERNGVFILVR